MAINYNIDFSFQIDRLLPPYKRRVINSSYLNALLSPLQTNNDSFITYVSETIRNTKITSQVIVLEKVLSELLGIAEGDPSVIIENLQIIDDFLIGETEDFSNGVFSDATFADVGIYADDTDVKVNFKIKIPVLVWSALTPQEQQEFRNYVYSVKLYGTSYLIETY